MGPVSSDHHGSGDSTARRLHQHPPQRLPSVVQPRRARARRASDPGEKSSQAQARRAALRHPCQCIDLVALAALIASPAAADPLRDAVAGDLPSLVAIYKRSPR